jgi:uncharacterized coiled-coil DUF342 family protein
LSATIASFIRELDALLKERDELLEELKELRDWDNRPKLTERDVADIRQAYRGGMRQRDLADNYGVNPSTISRIVRGIYH